MPHVELLAGRTLLCAYIVSEATHVSGSLEEFAIVAFRGVSQFTFGYPNDEALGSHPLYHTGLAFYAFNRIDASPYLKELGRRNAEAFPGSEGFWTSKQHYIVTFHDETLEVICSGAEFLGRVAAENAINAITQIKAEEARRASATPHGPL